jgi:hypothetical protein
MSCWRAVSSQHSFTEKLDSDSTSVDYPCKAIPVAQGNGDIQLWVLKAMVLKAPFFSMRVDIDRGFKR